MHKTILLGTIFLAAAALAADNTVQPLNVKPGLWQVTTTIAVKGMPQPMTHTYKSCVKKEDLHEYPFADKDNHCKYKVQSSTSSHMDVSGTCLPQEGGKTDFRIQLDVVDTEHANGSGQLTVDSPGGSFHGDYTGKGRWVSASCAGAE